MSIATNKMHRAAHGLDSGPDSLDWRARAACQKDPDRWFAERNPHRMQQTVHICTSHCPVLAQCSADAERAQPRHGIQAGVAWTTVSHARRGHPDTGKPRGRAATAQPAPIPCGRHCRDWRIA